jgi:hypothetical protein
MRVPANRKGFSGWKLTKRPQDVGMSADADGVGLGLTGNGYNDPY